MPDRLTHVSLFSGIGGLDLAAEAAKKTAQESKRTILSLKRHWKGTLIMGGIGLLMVMLLGCLQSYFSIFGGGVVLSALSSPPLQKAREL